MLEYWKSRRQIRTQIRAIEERAHRRLKPESPELIGFAVANDRFEVSRLKSELKRMETERLFKRGKKYGIERVPAVKDYWQTDEATQEKYLSDVGKALVISRIKDKRFAVLTKWAPIVALIISLLALFKSSIVALFKYLW